MKKFTFRSLLAIAAAGVLFTACKDENDDGNTSKTTYEFSVKAEDNPISAPADGKTYTILVTSTKTAQAGTSAVAYEVVSSPEWAPAELEQTALVITVAKNSSTEAREPGKVVLKQDESDKTLEITINQAGFSNSMSLDATYSTDRCKVLVIEPTITGFDQNPVYKWTAVTVCSGVEHVTTSESLSEIMSEIMSPRVRRVEYITTLVLSIRVFLRPTADRKMCQMPPLAKKSGCRVRSKNIFCIFAGQIRRKHLLIF